MDDIDHVFILAITIAVAIAVALGVFAIFFLIRRAVTVVDWRSTNNPFSVQRDAIELTKESLALQRASIEVTKESLALQRETNRLLSELLTRLPTNPSEPT